eukprot:c4445_g1_i1 orf=2-202(-)
MKSKPLKRQNMPIKSLNKDSTGYASKWCTRGVVHAYSLVSTNSCLNTLEVGVSQQNSVETAHINNDV